MINGWSKYNLLENRVMLYGGSTSVREISTYRWHGKDGGRRISDYVSSLSSPFNLLQDTDHDGERVSAKKNDGERVSSLTPLSLSHLSASARPVAAAGQDDDLPSPEVTDPGSLWPWFVAHRTTRKWLIRLRPLVPVLLWSGIKVVSMPL